MSETRPDVFTVILTGGIASGKTAVSDRFAALGVTVVDTDRIARQLVAPGEPALAEIVNRFGQDILDESGNLDRAKMRAIVFSDPKAKQRLEAILHPRIAAEALTRVAQATGPFCLLVVPLYTEAARWDWVDRVLVVDVDEATQVARVMERDGIDRDQAESILRSQASRMERLSLADDVIDNSGSLEELRARVDALHGKYLELAARRD